MSLNLVLQELTAPEPLLMAISISSEKKICLLKCVFGLVR